MKRTVDLNVAGGTVLIGPWGTFPRPILKLEDGTRTQQVLLRLRRDRAALEQLRREWSRLELPASGRSSDDMLLTLVEREAARRRLSILFLPADDDGVLPGLDPLRTAKPDNVGDWTAGEKIQEALLRTAPKLGGELRKIVEQLLDPVNVAVTVGLILALAASHAAGVGLIADAVLVGFAYAAAGLAGIKAIGDLIAATAKLIDAESEAEIDECAAEYAAAFVILGTAFLARFLRKAKARPKGKFEREAPASRQPKAQPKPRRPTESATKQADQDGATKKSTVAGAEVRAAREALARQFFEKEMGMSPAAAREALKGVDLNKAVEIVDIPPPATMTQYVRKGWGKPGNWFNPDPRQTADQLGLNGDPAIRELKTFVTPKGKALRSVAAPITDTWTDKLNPVATKGGGIQMTVSNAVRDAFKGL